MIYRQANLIFIYYCREISAEIEEPVASIIWASSRLSSECKELATVSEQLKSKYGRKFADSCRSNALNNVNEKLLRKLRVEPPSPMLVEGYLEEIAKTYKVQFTPRKIANGDDKVEELHFSRINIDEAAEEQYNSRVSTDIIMSYDSVCHILGENVKNLLERSQFLLP